MEVSFDSMEVLRRAKLL